jgi:hypothetical protein
MQCTVSHPVISPETSSLSHNLENDAMFSLYEVRTPWKSTGYLITVAKDRESKFHQAMRLGQELFQSRKLFETRDRPFAMLMSAYQEF